MVENEEEAEVEGVLPWLESELVVPPEAPEG